MDKNVHPLAATLIVLVSILTLATWLWCRGEAMVIGGPAGLEVDPRGHLYIQIQNKLLEHSPNGEFVALHDLEDLGIERVIGSTTFFSNGDVLLRRGPDTRSILDSVRSFLRQTNENSLTPDVANTGLYRCDLQRKHCQVFGNEAIDLKSTFSAFIDPVTDDVYISDTSRHLVRKYDEDGNVAADPVEGFHFPNQLLLHDGALLIADTNHHRIHIVEPMSASFGREISSANVVPSEAATAGQRWPNHFVRVRNEWWVNNMSSDTNYGGIYVFDDGWDFQRRIALPDNADPISLVNFNGEVLISDWYGDRVHRLSPEGKVLGDFRSSGLAETLVAAEATRANYDLYAWLAAFVGLTMVGALALKGTDWSQSPDTPDDDLRDDIDPNEPLLLKPNPKNVKKMRSNAKWIRILLLPIGIGIPALMFFTDLPFNALHYILIGGTFVVVYLISEWTIRVNLSSSIRITDNRVTILDHSGRETHAARNAVYFSNSFVAVDSAAVFLGQGNAPIYDREDVIRALENRLPATQRVSAWAMQKRLIAMRHPHGLATLMSVALLLVIAAYEFLR